jgi:hypothetical protein
VAPHWFAAIARSRSNRKRQGGDNCITVLHHQSVCATLARSIVLHESPFGGAGEEIDVNHGIVDVFAFQEALLMEAIFGIALLTIIWVGFRRWLEHKERLGRLIAEQTAERAAQYAAQIGRVEGRLKALEQIATDGGAQTVAQIDAVPANPVPDHMLKPEA